ncbi:hypothetical protein STEG23_011435 [Scotinomys teguina]
MRSERRYPEMSWSSNFFAVRSVSVPRAPRWAPLDSSCRPHIQAASFSSKFTNMKMNVFVECGYYKDNHLG